MWTFVAYTLMFIGGFVASMLHGERRVRGRIEELERLGRHDEARALARCFIGWSP
jgi:HAMP domain-containing protein